MPVNDLSQYLSNILLVARPGEGNLTGAQEAVFEHICREVGARPEDVSAAKSALRENGRAPAAVGRYSDQVRNLEDILMLAMAEGYLEQAGKARVLEFARQIGLSQSQMRQIAEDIRARFAQEKPHIQCPGCGASVSGYFRFCPQCGAVLNPLKLPGAAAALKVPASGVTLEFSCATPNPELIALAAQSKQFQELSQAGRHVCLAAWPRNRLLDALPLAERLAGEPARACYVDGKPQPWEEVFGFLPCLRQRERSYRPEAHCFGLNRHTLNLWGCQQAGMDWQADAEWFSYGHFDAPDVFVPDKNEIRHALDNQLRAYRFCPYLNLAKVELAVQALPAKIVLNGQEPWEYQDSAESNPRAMRLPARPTAHGAAPPARFVCGAAPRNYDLAKKILHKLYPDSSLKLLLK